MGELKLTKYKKKTVKLTEDDKEFLSTEAKVIVMIVRNCMEDFHVEHLSNTQMKELNPIIRNAIYTAITFLTKAGKGDSKALEHIELMLLSIGKNQKNYINL